MATKKKVKRKKARRTVMYSSGGMKLYAVRDASGRFKDIQRYSRAHRMDIQRGSSSEQAAKAATSAKKAAKKTVKKTVKKAVKKTATKTATRKTTKKSAKKAAKKS